MKPWLETVLSAIGSSSHWPPEAAAEPQSLRSPETGPRTDTSGVYAARGIHATTDAPGGGGRGILKCFGLP